MGESSHDSIIGLRVDNLITLGCKLLMFDAAYRKKTTPTDKDVARLIKSVIDKLPVKKRKPKIKPFADWTEQERIALFTRNSELIRSGEIGRIQDAPYDHSDYDISKQKCLRNFAELCFLIAILYAGYYYREENDAELLQSLDIFYTTISQKSHEAIGYWTPELSYVYSQGQHSREAGGWTIKIAKDILEKHGGIKGYCKLLRGEKGKVIREIEKAAKFNNERQVFKILNKLKNSKQN